MVQILKLILHQWFSIHNAMIQLIIIINIIAVVDVIISVVDDVITIIITTINISQNVIGNVFNIITFPHRHHRLHLLQLVELVIHHLVIPVVRSIQCNRIKNKQRPMQPVMVITGDDGLSINI